MTDMFKGDDAGLIELIEAAEAVIARWDSPRWKWDQHTGEFIARLRSAVEAARRPTDDASLVKGLALHMREAKEQVEIAAQAIERAGNLLDLDAVNAAHGAGQGEAVAWRVKDFADGWIYYNTADRAHLEAKTMSAGVVQALFASPPSGVETFSPEAKRQAWSLLEQAVDGLTPTNAARAEGRRSPGDPALEAGCLPERLTDQCADAWPRPHSHDMLAWLAERPSLELDYGFDAEEEDMFWRVHERSGSINDREWDLIGQGATPLAALLSAKSYMESTNAEQPE